MQDKFFDTDDQAIEVLVDGMSGDETIAKTVPAIEIVHFDANKDAHQRAAQRRAHQPTGMQRFVSTLE